METVKGILSHQEDGLHRDGSFSIGDIQINVVGEGTKVKLICEDFMSQPLEDNLYWYEIKGYTGCEVEVTGEIKSFEFNRNLKNAVLTRRSRLIIPKEFLIKIKGSK